MTSSQRLVHYSARHWLAQFKAIDKYIDTIRDDTNPCMPTERRREVQQSARDRLKYANVMRFKMCSDPLLINGIAFDVMLTDEKKRLHAAIDAKAVIDKAETKVKDLNALHQRQLIDRIYDLFWQQRWNRLTKPKIENGYKTLYTKCPTCNQQMTEVSPNVWECQSCFI